jgi:TRAP transporter TatT component family protein
MNRLVRLLVVAAACLVVACSPRQMAINRMASALAASSAVYEADNDPEFVRMAAPSTLKTVEMLLAQSPRNEQLLLTACSGFTEYAYAFLHVEAEVRAADDAGARELRARAVRMYERARGYCLRGLAARHPGMTLTAIAPNADGALQATSRADVPLLYWTAASWLAELSLAGNQLERVGELPTVRALLTRARSLDDTWSRGAIYEALIALDGLPAVAGGSAAAARADFDRAVELSNGKSVFAYVTYAATIANAAEKRRLLEQAVGIDVNATPERRLTNLVAQRYARAMLSGGRR